MTITPSNALVLTLERNNEIRGLIATYIKSVGCTPAEAETTGKALPMATELSPKLILMDLDFSDGSGLDFLRSLRMTPTLVETKVMLITREVRPQVVAPFVQLGISDFILKPFHSLELYAKMNKLLSLWKGPVPEELTKQDLPWPTGDGQTAETTSEGKVAELTYVTLPGAPGGTEQSADTEAQATDCLLIDDMPNVAKRFREIVPPHIQVESCTTAEEAIQMVRSRNFKMVIIDLQMPNVDSGMLLRQLSLFQNRAAFFALGLKTAANLVEDARTLGFDGVITKPFEPTKVMDLIDRYCESKEKLVTQDNIISIGAPPVGAPERQQAYFVRISNDIPMQLEHVAEACFSDAIINAPELRGNRKSIIDFLIKMKNSADTLGIKLYLVVGPEVVAYSREFIETKSLPMFSTLREAEEQAQKDSEGKV